MLFFIFHISKKKKTVTKTYTHICYQYICSHLHLHNIVEEQWKSIGERRKRGRVRAEPSDAKRTKGYFRCMVSIDRYTQPPSFISRAGCHTSIGFHGNCELLLHTMRCAPCGVVNEWRSELRNKWNVGYRRDGYVKRNHCEAYKVYTVKNKAFNTHTHTHTHTHVQ